MGVIGKKTNQSSNGESSTSGGHDFITLDAPKKQANIMIIGEGGTGKTSFCTRFMPGPIALINCDGRAEPAVVYAQNNLKKRIHYLRAGLHPSIRRSGPGAAQAEAERIVNMVVRNMEWAVAESDKGNVRSILIDTGTEYSEILKLSFDGVLTQTKEGSYGRDKDYINQQWFQLFQFARTGKAHFVVTSRAKEIWASTSDPATGKKKQEATGKYTYRCASAVYDAVDWAGHIRLRKPKQGGIKKAASVTLKEFELEIIKAGGNIAELGEVYTQDEWDEYGPFVYATWMQFQETSDPEDWS